MSIRNNKVKAFSLIEVIFAVALVSIISLSLINSFLTIRNVTKKQKILKDMLNIAENAMEINISGNKYAYEYENESYIVAVKIVKINDFSELLEVKVISKEIDDEIVIQRYR